jgi:hypothetical protein
MKASAFIFSTLIAGAAMGILSGIPLVGCLCILWLLGGGVLAVWLYRVFDKEISGISIGQGVLLGLVAGVIAAVIGTLMESIGGAASYAAVMDLFQNDPTLGPLFADNPLLSSPGIYNITNLVCNLIFYPVVGLLGGMIGGAIFKPKAKI